MRCCTVRRLRAFSTWLPPSFFYALKLIEPRRVVDENLLEFRSVLGPSGKPVERLSVVFRPERLDHGRIAFGGAGMRPIGPPYDAVRIGVDHRARDRRGVGIMRQLRDAV